MKSLLQDVRFGLRMLRKSPGFTAVAIITLALGIGANTAIFSLINAIMLRTLPVKDPQSLVILRWAARRAVNPKGISGGFCPGDSFEACSFSYPMFQQIHAEQKVFSGIFGFAPTRLTVNVTGRTSQLYGLFVSGDVFQTLGVSPAFGRFLNPSDDSGAAPPAVVVSYRFWKNVLGSDPAVVGKPFLVGRAPFTIVGVAPPITLELDPGIPTDFWLPLSFKALIQPYSPNTTSAANEIWLPLMARLKPGISIGQAAAATSAIFAASTTTGPEALFAPSDAPHVELPPAAYGLSFLRHEFSRPLYALLVAVALVLLIACANIAGLMLARSSARRKEIAVRGALGATRGRIIRQLLIESLLLSVTGGAAGVLLGYWGAEALAGFLARNWYMPLQVDTRPDLHVLAFTVLVSAIVGLAFGFAPVFSSGQLELVSALKEGSGSTDISRRGRTALANTLVVVQISLAVLVLVGAGLLVRTLSNLRAENVGFEPQDLLLFGVDTTYGNRTGGSLKVLHRELQEQLEMLPGVTSISYSAGPLLSGSAIRRPIFAQDQSASPILVNALPITPEFFKTMRIPLLAGRTFNAQDLEEKQSGKAPSYQPIVINEKLAHSLFGDQAPVGRLFRMGGPSAALSPLKEVVGVVGDTKYDALRAIVQPTIYSAITGDGGTFEIRTAMDPKALMPAVRATVSRFDSNLLITDMKTQMEQIDQNIYQERLIANLSSLFALLALIVACVGIYGLLSYQVTRRTHEIGIRLALGAQRGDVLRLVIRQGAILAALGVLIGIAAALAVTRYLQSFLFGVKPSDPLTIAAVACGLIAVALLASYIPARRAMKTDPMVALRYE